MNEKPQGCFPVPLIYLVLMISALVVLRTGYLTVSWLAYAVFGSEATATVEHSESYQALVRKPRPSHYVTRYRGSYKIDDNGATSSFDTSDFIMNANEVLVSGSQLAVRRLIFLPSVSRPVLELGWTQIIIPVVLLIPALFLLGMMIVMLKMPAIQKSS